MQVQLGVRREEERTPAGALRVLIRTFATLSTSQQRLESTINPRDSPSSSSSGRMTGLRKERTSGIVQSPLYMNLVVTARTGISAKGKQKPCRDLHMLSGGVFWWDCATALDILRPQKRKQISCKPNRRSSSAKFDPRRVFGIFRQCVKSLRLTKIALASSARYEAGSPQMLTFKTLTSRGEQSRAWSLLYQAPNEHSD